MKKIMYYLPTVILFIYAIIYLPLLECLVDKYVNTNNIFPYEINNIMARISYLIIGIAIVMKFIFKRKEYNIGKWEFIFNIILFVVLIIVIFFLGIITAFA